MASDAELDKTLERSERVENMWKAIEEKLQDFDREKEEFAREFGFEYEKFLEFMSNRAKEARGVAGAETLAEMEKQSADIKQQFEEEVAQAQARHEAEKQLEKTSGAKRSRRIRDMI